MNELDKAHFTDFTNHMWLKLLEKDGTKGDMWKEQDTEKLVQSLEEKVFEYITTRRPHKLISVSNLAALIWMRNAERKTNPTILEKWDELTPTQKIQYIEQIQKEEKQQQQKIQQNQLQQPRIEQKIEEVKQTCSNANDAKEKPTT